MRTRLFREVRRGVDRPPARSHSAKPVERRCVQHVDVDARNAPRQGVPSHAPFGLGLSLSRCVTRDAEAFVLADVAAELQFLRYIPTDLPGRGMRTLHRSSPSPSCRRCMLLEARLVFLYDVKARRVEACCYR
jgi:hypothetical protein